MAPGSQCDSDLFLTVLSERAHDLAEPVWIDLRLLIRDLLIRIHHGSINEMGRFTIDTQTGNRIPSRQISFVFLHWLLQKERMMQ